MWNFNLFYTSKQYFLLIATPLYSLSFIFHNQKSTHFFFKGSMISSQIKRSRNDLIVIVKIKIGY